MIFNVQPVSQNGEVVLTARSDDEATHYGSCVGRYSPEKNEITVERFYVHNQLEGRRVEVALFSALRVLAERQLRHAVIVKIGPSVPPDIAKSIEALLKKAKYIQ